MKLSLQGLCDSANVSQEGKLNILGLFTHIGAHEFPYVHPAMVLVFRLQLLPTEFDKEHKVELTFIDQDGKVLIKLDGTVKSVGHGTSARELDQILTINNLVLPGPGNYSFRVNVNGSEIGDIPLIVESRERTKR